MKIILLKDIENLGKRWDVKEVKRGYAKNFLLPKGLVQIATSKNMESLEERRELEKKKAEEELKLVQKQASLIDGTEVTIPVKVEEEGTVYGSVTSQMMAEELAKLGFKDIRNSQIVLESPIKELGEFPVIVTFEHNLEAEIKVIVVEEKE